jgi:hypothetical protein
LVSTFGGLPPTWRMVDPDDKRVFIPGKLDKLSRFYYS